MSSVIKKLITHSGSFHADDIFACAAVQLFLDRQDIAYNVIRTRDEAVLATGDYVFDVGGVYDHATGRYDHHQKDSAGVRPSGIPYASFGLVWKHYGLPLCGNNEEAWQLLDRKIASPIDAMDNGMNVVEKTTWDGVMPYNVEHSFLVFSPTWKENNLDIDTIFFAQVAKAKELLKREIQVISDDIEAKKIIVQAYADAEDKSIIELTQSFPRYLYQRVLSELPEPVYVIMPGGFGKYWKIEAISKNPTTLESRKLFPEAWRGFLDANPALAEVTGIPDAVFSHRAGFLMETVSLEGAHTLARSALGL